MKYKIYTIHTYFSSNFTKKFINALDIEKYKILLVYQPSLMVIDISAKLKNYSDLLNIDFKYFGVYDLQKQIKDINVLIYSDSYVILMVDVMCEADICYCRACQNYNEKIVVLT